MKKLLLLFITLGLTKGLLSQNIGIGTSTPGAKLQINHRTAASSPTLRLFDSTAGTGSSILFAKEGQSNSFSVVSSIGLLAANNTLDFRTTFNSGILLRGDGRVGINNVASPVATLHIGGGVKINDTLNVSKGVILEDTLLVKKSINILAGFKMNGNNGTDGQILVSRGENMNPEWRNPTYPANERASAILQGTSFLVTATPFSATVPLSDFLFHYNNSSATFDYTNNEVVINKSGLYQVTVSYGLQSGALPNIAPYGIFSVDVQVGSSLISSERVAMYPSSGITYGNKVNFSFTRYISAGTSLETKVNIFNFPVGSILSTVPGSHYLSFHLIAE
jgi:hypothetical protein